jgi:hypothetical protein
MMVRIMCQDEGKFVIRCETISLSVKACVVSASCSRYVSTFEINVEILPSPLYRSL